MPHLASSEVWLGLRFATLLCSVVGSCWLLCAAWKPSYLFTRQLRHLAVADLGLSLAAPGYELGMWLLMFGDDQVTRNVSLLSRCFFRSFLCASCFIEMQIAMGVLGSALRWQRCPKVLASCLIISWITAALIGLGDAFSMRADTDTFAAVVAVVLCTTVLLSLLMYLISILAVLWTPSPSAVVRRASQRALAFPCSFLITLFPQWLLYIGLSPQDWFRNIATIAIYSNGCVNSLVYSWQNRRICPDSRRNTLRHNNSNHSSHSSLFQSFHVGFGRVSRLFPSSNTLNTLNSLGESSNARETECAQMGLLFEVRGEVEWEHLCIDIIHTQMGRVLLQDQVLSLRQEGSLSFSTVPIWLDVSDALGAAQGAQGALNSESSQGQLVADSPNAYIELEYRLVSRVAHSASSSATAPGRHSHCSVPLERGLWLISESAAERTTVSLISTQAASEVSVLSPAHSTFTAHSAAIRAAEVDTWAAFMQGFS